MDPFPFLSESTSEYEDNSHPSDFDAYRDAAAKRGQDDGRVIEVTYTDDEDEVKNEYRRATAVQSTDRQTAHRGNGTLADPICIDP